MSGTVLKMASNLLIGNNHAKSNQISNSQSKKHILSSTKGHYGARSRLYKTLQSNIKSLQYSFRDRKIEKELLDLFGSQE